MNTRLILKRVHDDEGNSNLAMQHWSVVRWIPPHPVEMYGIIPGIFNKWEIIIRSGFMGIHSVGEESGLIKLPNTPYCSTKEWPEYDLNAFKVNRQWVEEAVLAYNRKYGNNSQIEMEDVIL